MRVMFFADYVSLINGDDPVVRLKHEEFKAIVIKANNYYAQENRKRLLKEVEEDAGPGKA